MNSINVDKVDTILKNFIAERDWDQFHSLKNLSMALTVEASELLEHFQWLTEGQSNKTKDDPKLKTKVSEEIADIFIYLLRIASKAEIDIEEVVLNKIKNNAEKYPVEKAKGSATKYNELH